MENNSYLAARHEWDERNGPLRSQKRNWQIVAMAMIGVATLAIGNSVLLANRLSRTPPFVAVVNERTGQVITSGIAAPMQSMSEAVRQGAIASWIEDLRMVSADGMAQRRAVMRVYALLADHSSAATEISAWYSGNPPATRAQTGTTWAEVNNVLPLSDHTYQVEWTETERDMAGVEKKVTRWKSAITVAITAPDSEEAARKNPLGIYVTSISFSKVF